MIIFNMHSFFTLLKSSHRLTRTLPPRTYNEDYENTEDEDLEEVEEDMPIKEEAVEGDELYGKSSNLAPSKSTPLREVEEQVSVK